jgi:ArsR family transcriptional regulator, zinc-responsive transcriptional repressor
MERNPEDIQAAARIFKALSHPARLEIACHLSQDGPSTQKHLISRLGWPQSTMARHLGPLRDVGLIEGERRGPEVELSVTSELVSEMVQSLCDWLHEDRHGTTKEDA